MKEEDTALCPGCPLRCCWGRWWLCLALFFSGVSIHIPGTLSTKTMKSFLETEMLFSPLLFLHKCRSQEGDGCLSPCYLLPFAQLPGVLAAQHPLGGDPVPASVAIIAPAMFRRPVLQRMSHMPASHNPSLAVLTHQRPCV